MSKDIHCSIDLEGIFQACFAKTHNTTLVGGNDEPLYMPKLDNQGLHTIYYRFDYFSSALHEIAHWCIAGDAKRMLVDYGYWYEPDGRNAQQQKAFMQVEVKPQAIEKAFSIASGVDFRVSMDNIEADNDNKELLASQGDSLPIDLKQNTRTDHVSDAEAESIFKEAVDQQYKHYLQHAFPSRAQTFINALSNHYGSPRD